MMKVQLEKCDDVYDLFYSRHTDRASLQRDGCETRIITHVRVGIISRTQVIFGGLENKEWVAITCKILGNAHVATLEVQVANAEAQIAALEKKLRYAEAAHEKNRKAIKVTNRMMRMVREGLNEGKLIKHHYGWLPETDRDEWEGDSPILLKSSNPEKYRNG